LYNCSVASLSRRQKLEKEIKAKNSRKKWIVQEQENLEGELRSLKKEI